MTFEWSRLCALFFSFRVWIACRAIHQLKDPWGSNLLQKRSRWYAVAVQTDTAPAWEILSSPTCEGGKRIGGFGVMFVPVKMKQRLQNPLRFRRSRASCPIVSRAIKLPGSGRSGGLVDQEQPSASPPGPAALGCRKTRGDEKCKAPGCGTVQSQGRNWEREACDRTKTKSLQLRQEAGRGATAALQSRCCLG